MEIINDFADYQIIDMANGEKLEQWGKYTLQRPDPQIIWNDKTETALWKNVNAIYHRSKTGGGYWEKKSNLPDYWQVKYRNLTFNIKLMGFKHTGLFPEQAVNWNWMINKINQANRKIRVLNLFAYTGGATVACLSAGASVVHVDASKGMVAWAKENVISSNLQDADVRYIVDDCLKFVLREKRRGNTYDAIIMDPPSFGRGSNGEVWDIENNLYELVNACNDILSDNPLFFLINSYTAGLSPTVLENILYLTINKKMCRKITSGEIGVPMKNSNLVLPCGIYGRWENE